MAGTTELAVLHVFHGHFVCAFFCLEQIWMAAVAPTKRLNVGGVREGDITDVFILDLEDYIPGMTFNTVAGLSDTACLGTVMAGPAEFAVFHGFHGYLVCTFLSLEQIRMAAVASSKHLYVSRMGKSYLADNFVNKLNILHLVASGAIGRYRESPFPVMTGTAGLALLHHFHGDMVAVVLLFENFRMTLLTIGAMYIMIKYYIAYSLCMYGDFTHHEAHPSHATHPLHATPANGIQS